MNILISNIVYVRRLTQRSTLRCGERPRTSEQRPRDVCDCEFRWALSALYVTRPTVGYFFVSLSYQSSSIFRCSSGTPGWPKPRTGHGQFSYAVPHQPARAIYGPRRRLRAFLSARLSSPALPVCLWPGLRGGVRGGTTRGSGLGPPSAATRAHAGAGAEQELGSATAKPVAAALTGNRVSSYK